MYKQYLIKRKLQEIHLDTSVLKINKVNRAERGILTICVMGDIVVGQEIDTAFVCVCV